MADPMTRDAMIAALQSVQASCHACRWRDEVSALASVIAALRAAPPADAGAPPALVALVREWQEARKPATLSAPGEFLAETFQAAVRRMSAADEALAAYRLEGASDDVHGPVQAVQPDGGRTSDAVALSGVPAVAGDARPAAALSLRDELAEIIRWRFRAADGEIMDGVKMLKAAQEIADAIAPYIEEATGGR